MKQVILLASAAGLAVVLTGVVALGDEEHRRPAMSRIAIRKGRFVEKDTGRPFVPLGVNYYRTSGKFGHATFCPGFYDRAFVEKMLADVAASGFNTVRTFQVYHVGEDGILTSPKARELSPEYLANMVHFLEQARKHNVRVIFTWDIWIPDSEWWSLAPLPNEAKYSFRPNREENMGLNGCRVYLGDVRTRANAIAEIIRALRRRDPELLPVVLAWELENEVYFAADRAPFDSRQGTFNFAGKDYALSSDEQTQALMDAMVAQWADACADTIHRADPEALVSAGVFTFAAVGRGGPGSLSKDDTKDSRIPARPVALLHTGLDYIDIHLYAWKTEKEGVSDFLARNLASDEWNTLQAEARKLGKPIMSGEFGVFAHYLRKPPDRAIDHQMGVECLSEQLRGIKEHGFAGALYWPYGNPESTPNDETPAIVLFPQYAKTIKVVWGSGSRNRQD